MANLGARAYGHWAKEGIVGANCNAGHCNCTKGTVSNVSECWYNEYCQVFAMEASNGIVALWVRAHKYYIANGQNSMQSLKRRCCCGTAALWLPLTNVGIVNMCVCVFMCVRS